MSTYACMQVRCMQEVNLQEVNILRNTSCPSVAVGEKQQRPASTPAQEGESNIDQSMDAALFLDCD